MPINDCALTQGYVQDCQDFFGGVKVIRLIEFHNVIQPITAVAGVISTLVKLATKKFQRYEIQAHSAEADDMLTVKVEAGTRSTKQSIKFPLNGLSVTLRNEIEKLAQNRIIAVWEDENGQSWMFGKDYGLRLVSAGAKSGKALSDKVGYDLVFEGEEKYQAFKVDAAAVLTLETPGV